MCARIHCTVVVQIKKKKGNTIHFNHRTAIPIEIYELQLYNFYIYVK